MTPLIEVVGGSFSARADNGESLVLEHNDLIVEMVGDSAGGTVKAFKAVNAVATEEVKLDEELSNGDKAEVFTANGGRYVYFGGTAKQVKEYVNALSGVRPL